MDEKGLAVEVIYMESTRHSNANPLRAEAIGSKRGWVIPLTQEDKEYFAYLRTVFKRYNIVPAKGTRLE